MEKMLSETRLKRTHFVRAFLLVAVAVSAFWMGLNDASAACPYNYDSSLSWFEGTICHDDPDCADIDAPCWVEACSSDCTDGETWGYFGYQEYGCDRNCDSWLTYCAECN